ncbi:MAG: RNA polymerase subunit sigma-70 [Planctomycetes bacterium]|nr:RNA polymerase subunit sigma-70 [Planctomycetota bacterium]
MTAETKSTPDAAAILRALRHGDGTAVERLAPLVQSEIRAIVSSRLVDDDESAPRQAAAMVQEAYARLVERRQGKGRPSIDWQDRANFFAIGAGLVRRTLVDHARARRAAKRNDHDIRLTLDGSIATRDERGFPLVALDRTLARLTELDIEQGRVTELRFFGAMSVEDVAHVLEMSPRAVDDAWLMARAWIHREIAKFDTP